MKNHKEVMQFIVRLSQKYKYFLLVIALGVLLMMINFPVHHEAKTREPPENATETLFNLTAFEDKLKQNLSLIDGAGRVDLVLSLKSGEESVYAANINKSSQTSGNNSVSTNYQSTLSIISNSSYGETPILIKNNYPEFRGAVILCDGADIDRVRLQIDEAVRAVCDITSDNISIIKMKK